jgi:hypothetical protein
MSVKFYKIVWLLFLAIVALTYVTGNLTAVAGVWFGFAVFGLVFMGMMSVLPTSIVHPAADGDGLLRSAAAFFRRAKGRFRESHDSWVSSSSVEVRHPKFH